MITSLVVRKIFSRIHALVKRMLSRTHIISEAIWKGAGKVKLTVVIDNNVPISSRPFLLGEHGLSFFLETEREKYLFDAGQTSAVVHNLGLMGISPKLLTAAIISHGHYDHTGGLEAVLTQAGKRLPVFAHENIFAKRYSMSKGTRRFVGIPFREEHLTSLGADFRYISVPVQLTDNVWVSGAIPRTEEYETGDRHLVRFSECEDSCQDSVLDDMGIYYASPKGLVVISGCAHSGIINMIRRGMQLTGADRLHAVVGGTHLGPVGSEQQEKTLQELQKMNPDLIASGHCTGFAMMARLQQAFGEKFVPAFVGAKFEL